MWNFFVFKFSSPLILLCLWISLLVCDFLFLSSSVSSHLPSRSDLFFSFLVLVTMFLNSSFLIICGQYFQIFFSQECELFTPYNWDSYKVCFKSLMRYIRIHPFVRNNVEISLVINITMFLMILKWTWNQNQYTDSSVFIPHSETGGCVNFCFVSFCTWSTIISAKWSSCEWPECLLKGLLN